MSAPPIQQVTIPLGRLFFSKIELIICMVAILKVAAEGPGFHITQLPQIREIAKFQPKTAFGKLKAVITPTIPKGFHYSIMKCSLRSEGITYPLIDLDNPQAKSQISIVS